MKRIDELIGWLSKSLSVVAAAAVLAIMVTMTADVVARIVTGRSIAGAFELVETTVVVVAFLGLAYAERSDTNVRVTIVSQRLPPRVRRVVLVVANTVAVVVVAVMAYAGWLEMMSSYERGEARHGLVNFPLWPARLSAAIGLSAVALELLVTVLRTARSPIEDEGAERAGAIRGGGAV